MDRTDKIFEWLCSTKGCGKVKVVYGLRGAGKSEALRRYAHWLKESGVPEEKILYVDFDSPEFFCIKSPNAYFDFIDVKGGKGTYLIYDEAPNPRESGLKALRDGLKSGLFAEVVVCHSGRFLSDPDLERKILGKRLIGFEARYPAFSEHLRGRDGAFGDALREYLVTGGNAAVLPLESESLRFECARNFVTQGIFEEARREGVKLDIRLVTYLTRAMLDLLGRPTSLRQIQTDIFVQCGEKYSPTTIGIYLQVFLNARVIDFLPPYDLFAQEVLSRQSNTLYMTTPVVHPGGFRLTPNFEKAAQRNAVYCELKARLPANDEQPAERRIFTGRSPEGEVMFVVFADSTRPDLVQVVPADADRATWNALFAAILTTRNVRNRTMVHFGPPPPHFNPGPIRLVPAETFFGL